MANHIARSTAVLTFVFTTGLLAPFAMAQQEPAAQPEPAMRPEFADAQPEPEVDAALRSRVDEFFQLHVDLNYRKAFEMVAEETKDEYFAERKLEIIDFRIDAVQYSDDLEHALVTLIVTRVWGFHGQETNVTLPMATTWKIEDGEWMWYHDKGRDSITPMGLSNMETMPEDVLITENEDGSINLPKDFSPETLAAAAEAILRKTGVDKTEVILSRNEASEDSFVFHNSNAGSIGLELAGAPAIPGLTVTLDKSLLGANEDATVTVRYAPASEQDDAEVAVPLQDFSLKVLTVPFNQRFSLAVRFE